MTTFRVSYVPLAFLTDSKSGDQSYYEYSSSDPTLLHLLTQFGASASPDAMTLDVEATDPGEAGQSAFATQMQAELSSDSLAPVKLSTVQSIPHRSYWIYPPGGGGGGAGTLHYVAIEDAGVDKLVMQKMPSFAGSIPMLFAFYVIDVSAIT